LGRTGLREKFQNDWQKWARILIRVINIPNPNNLVKFK